MSVADPKCFVRLEEPIPGIDHIKYLDHREFAQAHGTIDAFASSLGVDRINDFYSHVSGSRLSGGGPWFPASEGLAAFRAVKAEIESRAMPEAQQASLAPVLEILGRLEDLLSRAELRGVRFCIVGNY